MKVLVIEDSDRLRRSLGEGLKKAGYAPDLAADPDKLELMVSNLLSNTVADSPASSAVRCAATEAGGRVTLTVSNHAPQLRAEDLPLIFDRFWRQDTARTGGQHVGLGLTLARALTLSKAAASQPTRGVRIHAYKTTSGSGRERSDLLRALHARRG